MKKTLILLFLLVATSSFGQNSLPLDISNLKFLQSPQFSLYRPDTTLWLYMNKDLGALKLATYKKLIFIRDSLERVSVQVKDSAVNKKGYTSYYRSLSFKQKDDSTGTDGYTRRDRLLSSLATKENKISISDSTKWWRGDKTWHLLPVITSEQITTILGFTPVKANALITGATKTKITYGNNGLVLEGLDATTSDIAPSTNRRYITDAQITALHGAVTVATANGLSLAGQALSLATASMTTTGALTAADWNTFNSKQSAVFFVENFQEVSTASSGQINTLAHSPRAPTAILVSMNGVELKSSQFSVGIGTVQVTIPVYQYDQVTISYTY